MKEKFSALLGLSIVCALVAAFGLSACSTGSASSSTPGLTGGVAATVNGQDIMEDDITTYIQNWRETNGMADEETWANYLISMGQTPAELREYFIDGHISEILTEKAASEMGVEVTQTDVDDTIANMRLHYETDEAWNEALQQAGFTEEEYRESVYNGLIAQRVEEVVSEKAEPVSDQDLLETAQMYASYIDGMRRSSHILFNLEDKETAENVLKQLQEGSISFEDAAKEYSIDSSAESGGDVGWDRINSFVTEYADALSALEVGGMSGLVESQYGYHIIKCTDLYHAPEEGVTSIDQVPEALVTMLRDQLESSAKTTAVSDWYAEYKEAADIVINDMPEGLPYDVDLSKYQTEEVASSDDASVVIDADAEAEDAETSTEEAGVSSEDAGASSEDAAVGEEQPAEISSEAEGRSSEAA